MKNRQTPPPPSEEKKFAERIHNASQADAEAPTQKPKHQLKSKHGSGRYKARPK